MNERKPIQGSCFCKKVKFRLLPPTAFLAHCHCESCRLSHAAPFVTWTGVPKDRFSFKSGEKLVKWFQSSEWIEWGFCSHCGSSMLYRALKEGHPESPSPERIYVAVASLTPPFDRSPETHVSFEEKVPWLQFQDKLPKYKGKGDELIDCQN